MAALEPLTTDCPSCGGLIGWNRTGDYSGPLPAVILTLDDLSARRHRACGVFPREAA